MGHLVILRIRITVFMDPQADPPTQWFGDWRASFDNGQLVQAVWPGSVSISQEQAVVALYGRRSRRSPTAATTELRRYLRSAEVDRDRHLRLGFFNEVRLEQPEYVAAR